MVGAARRGLRRVPGQHRQLKGRRQVANLGLQGEELVGIAMHVIILWSVQHSALCAWPAGFC